MSIDELLGDAMGYRARGWSCISVLSKDGKKKPLVKWKPYQDRLPTEAELRIWFSKPPVNGIGIITGKASGPLIVRDFDDQDGYKRWCVQNPALARTLPTVQTARGFHIYAESDLQRNVKFADGEFRGNGITLAPRSLHFSGIRYKWVIPLSAGRLPFVEHKIFTGGIVTEFAEAIGSVLSAISVPNGDINPSSALSVSSVTSLEQLIATTLPTQPSQRNNCILSLARGMKFNLRLSHAETGTLRTIVRKWHEQALPIITTKSFDETWSDFLHAFKRAKYPLGVNLVDAAAERVDPNDLPEVAQQYDSEPVRKLIGLCYELGRLIGTGRFFLSTHDAAKRLGISPMQVWRLLNMLCDDGVLKLINKGNARRASRYLWLGDKSIAH